MKTILIFGVLISASAQAALFDSIESVDVLRQQSKTADAQRAPASETKAPAENVNADSPAVPENSKSSAPHRE